MSTRQRTRFSRALVVLAAVLLLIGSVAGVASSAVFDSDGFALRARRAVEKESVRELLAERITTEVVEANRRDLISFRPVVQAAVTIVVQSKVFRDLVAVSARSVHQAVTSRPGEDFLFRVSGIAATLTEAVRELRPDLAERIPQSLDATLLRVEDVALSLDLWHTADRVAWLSAVLPLAALVTAGLALLTAVDRRRALHGLGLALVVTGALMVVGYVVAGSVLAGVVDDPLEARAAHDTLSVFLGDLVGGGILLAALGIVAVAGSVVSQPGARLSPSHIRDATTRVLAWQPRSRAAQAVRGAALLGGGLLALARPARAAEIVMVLAGISLAYVGVVAILGLVVGTPAPATAASSPDGRRRVAGALAGLAAVLLVGVIAVAAVRRASEDRVAEDLRCNGHAELCDRPVDHVAFPTTHNSMSAASDGWFVAQHANGIVAQLDAGVRGFLIDVYNATPVRGVVLTQFPEERLQRLGEAVGPDLVQRAQGIRSLVGPAGNGPPSLYLCHAYCELGATPVEKTLGDMRRWLDGHRSEVVVVFIEDYAPPSEVAKAFGAAGLERYAYRHPPRTPWPSLRTLIESGQRLVVMAEHEGGSPSWYLRGFPDQVQETPYSFPQPEAFSCVPNRGDPDAELFLVNHWLETARATPGEARLVNAREVLLDRVRACEAERDRFPSLVAVNFYDEGDLFAVVDELNGIPA